MAKSRLDIVHAPPHLVDKIATTSHKAGISDHYRVEVAFNIATGQTRRRTYLPDFWKLNTSVLDNQSFHGPTITKILPSGGKY